MLSLNPNCLLYNQSGSPELTIYRNIGGAGAANLGSVMARMNPESNYQPNSTIIYLDAPNTTSACVYTVYFRVNTGGTTGIHNSTVPAKFIAQEIGA